MVDILFLGGSWASCINTLTKQKKNVEFINCSSVYQIVVWSQVTEFTANELGDKFDFEHRGTVFVKGKGDMNTYLLVRKKDGAAWDWTTCTSTCNSTSLRRVCC